MKRIHGVVAALSLTAATLVGCGQAVETAVETATGSDIDISDEGVTVTGEGGESVTIDAEGDTMTFTDEEAGTSITTGADQELPAGLPDGFPVPPAESILSTSEDAAGTIIIAWSWSEMTQQEFDDYIAALEGAGYVKQPDDFLQDFGDDGFIRGATLASTTHEVTVNGQNMQGMGGISVNVTPVS